MLSLRGRGQRWLVPLLGGGVAVALYGGAGWLFRLSQTFDLAAHDRLLNGVARLRELPLQQQWLLTQIELGLASATDLVASQERLKLAFRDLAQVPVFLSPSQRRELEVAIQNYAHHLVAYQQGIRQSLGDPARRPATSATTLDVVERVEAVGTLYMGYCQQVLERNHRVQRLIYGGSLILVAGIAAWIVFVFRRSSETLRRTEQQYRDMYERALEGMFQTDAQGTIIHANPAFYRLTGIPAVARSGFALPTLYLDSNRYPELREILQTQEVISHAESQILRGDGTIAWVSENGQLIRDLDGQVSGYFGTLVDITERKFAEETLRQEQEKSEKILLNILPRTIVSQLKQETKAIADRFEEVTILFADIVDFTGLASRISATQLVDLLNQIFTAFDQLADRYRLEKIKTIGDAYMVVGGVPDRHPAPVAAVAEMALAMQHTIQQFQRPDHHPFRLRIGINTGTVVAGVIGSKKLIYDLWGDAVNVASRMESQGIPGGIQVTATTYEALKGDYLLEPQGVLQVKGRGEMLVYGLQGRQSAAVPLSVRTDAPAQVDVIPGDRGRPCGLQRLGFPIDIGLEYEQFAYRFQEWVRLEQTLAVDYCLSQFRDPERCLLVAATGGWRLYVHQPELKVLPYSAGLAGLCQRMRQDIEVMDRRWRLRVFSRCFVGQEAVTWLSTTWQISRQEAVALGQECLKRGLFAHVVSEQAFADDYFFYRFRQDGPPGQRFSEKIGFKVAASLADLPLIQRR